MRKVSEMSFAHDLLLRAYQGVDHDARITSHIAQGRESSGIPETTRHDELQNRPRDPQSPEAQHSRHVRRKWGGRKSGEKPNAPMVSGDEEYAKQKEMRKMTDENQIIAKMDPMARRALAAIEGVQKAIKANDTDGISAGIMAAENALAMLKSDLDLHDQITKAMSKTQTAERFMGVIPQYDNNASDYNGTENAVAMGVSRHGRATGFFTPHRIV